MKIFRLLKSAVNQADFFSTTQLIRYQQQPQFKTFTGGIFSLVIVILLSTIFANMSLSAVRREHIDWSGQTAKDAIPPRLDLNFSTFNIGVELEGFNLSSPLQYFDVIMTLYTFENKELQGGGTRIPLSMCRREDWAVNDDILGNFDRMNASNWLCPNINSSFFIQGKWTSDHFTYLSLDVVDCGTANPTATCANKSDIEQALQNIMHFSVYYINSLVTPDVKQPITYYLEDKDYVYFGKTLGGANYIFVSDYQITTDNSIFPYQDNVQTTGGIVMLPTRISVQEVANGWYASFIFRKATDRYIYSRNFTKFDSVVSYTGGLFGALIGVLFLMNHYTRTSFEVALGCNIYSNDDHQDSDAKNMNLFRYVKYYIYKGLSFLDRAPDWKQYENYDKCRKEVQKHLDIKFILDKLNFLETAVFAICGQEKFKGLHLRNKVTLKDAEKYRDYYLLRGYIINSVLRRKKQKRKSFMLKEKQQTNNRNMIQTPSSIFNQSTPLFNIRNGKVMPDQSPKPIQQLSDVKGAAENFDQESVNTNRFTKKTRRHIEEMRSYLSSMQSVELQNPNVQISELAHQLQEIKRQGENGDQLCREIWTNLDEDVRIILESKMNKLGHDMILERQDIQSSANQYA